ncbi:branched-chain amino acid ABC transporter substrate-binding protein [Mycolicibacterium litorale]|uniref:Branched chain amino acid ABC transporter substrate-binding protein n=1 Tax=Mycolicibacterium litorale TaxID=758802 RepID=A0AAD1IHP1_9MYCO|nr:branched-chain amino acid ABC transporter substrate-binding protein [Mycolicibacterium litorale]MCV7414159.1 branched-chain amino acid ABC transporter substrate-binding protein [Mycolicibacterium litorale]TDY02149.1 amino acid/amide ABC transporter substrate-binding protein (HAAT family) [Mycolicibacterium litorale]BBY15654.1 branched chain amino acid ABC transporter substrate-binding protein [Mycolicibacterium litorale]
MRGRVARNAFALGSAGLLALALGGCSQSTPEEEAAQTNLKIVEQVQIDENGAEVKAAEGASPADPAGDGKATCPPLSIAMAGALNGPDAALGINIKNGVQLAVDKHNAANPGCQVQLKTFDTEGDPQKASAIAPQIVDDQYTIGLVGPAFSGETNATGDVFNQAGLVAATASATNTTLSEKGWRTFFRGLANDGVQGPSVANYLKNTLGHQKVCVVDDSTDYGLGLAQAVRDTLGPVADAGCNISVKKGDKDFSAAVTQVKGVSPQSVFFSGYYAEAAPFVQQLKDGGVEATFVSADGTKDPEFVKQAGESSKDALLSCPCGPATGSFAEEYTQKFGQEPGTYSTEGYDLGTILVKGIDSGAITRQALLDYVRNYNGQGVARNYQWTPQGELTTTLIWMYKVQ